MASENETVADIVKEMRRNEEVFHHLYWCEYANRIEAANRREVESYKRLLMTSQCALENEIVKNQNLMREVDGLNFELMTAKSEQKTAANVIIEQTNKVEKLDREVAELRECLKEAVVECCHGCPSFGGQPDYECKREHGECFVQAWRSAAGMEGVTK